MSEKPNAQTELPHPLLRAADIQANLEERTHEYNPKATISRAKISDLTGIKDRIGVAYAKLPPGGESTTMHYHLIESEWIYVLKGSGTLRLLDASLPIHERNEPRKELKPGHGSLIESQIEDNEVGPGDFAGFPGGALASRYAHSLVAGPEGMEYLMGGTRDKVEVCSYPLAGKTVIFDDNSNVCAAVPESSDPSIPEHHGV